MVASDLSAGQAGPLRAYSNDGVTIRETSGNSRADLAEALGSLTGSSPSGFGSSSARAWWNVPTPPPPCRHYTLTARGPLTGAGDRVDSPVGCHVGASQIRGARRTAADNAAIESFFALLQKNVLNRRAWPTREELRIAIVTPPRTFDPGRIRADHEAVRDPSGLTDAVHPIVQQSLPSNGAAAPGRADPTSSEEKDEMARDTRRLTMTLNLDCVLDDELLARREIADFAESHVRA